MRNHEINWRKFFRAAGIAAVAAGTALALQWLIVPFGGIRTPFAFFLLAIGATSFLAGWIPALAVVLVGAINGAFLFPPQGTIGLVALGDWAAILIFLFVGSVVTFGGHHVRLLYKKSKRDERRLEKIGAELQIKVDDLQSLHDLSTRVSQTTHLKDQLQLILEALIRFHGAAKGLLSLYDKQTNELSVAASLGFAPQTLERLKGVKGGDGACGLVCLEKRRIVIGDTEIDPRFAKFRDIADQEGFRSVHSTPMFTPMGEILGALSVHFPGSVAPTDREIHLADICARKAAIYIQRADMESLAMARERELHTVLHASAVPFSVLSAVRDESGTIVDFSWKYVNEAATHALERSEKELIGLNVMDVFPKTWETPGLFDAYASVINKKQVREVDLHVTTGGADSWFHVVASPIGDDAAIWFADVTPQKQREVELKLADKRKDEFLATLAHELRNPLAPIRQASLLSRKPNATEAQRVWAQEVIDRQVQHMALLLDDLLDVSRITRGVLHLRIQPTSLVEVVDSGVETARHLLDQKRHTLKIDVPRIQVCVDPLRLSQVVSNLLTNAAKYSNPGGTIQVTAHVTGADLTLTVSDNGIGLTDEQRHSIFEMFSQVKSAEERSEGGLGIGLSLTKGLVQLHGGRIEATSAGLGLGSSFIISLPGVAMGSIEEQRTQQRERSPLVLSRTILVADDNQDAAQTIATLLRIDGHIVTVVHDGISAVKSFAALKPDVVLLDIGMPGMSGYDVAKRIRILQPDKSALLIAITGWGQQNDVTRARAAGFDIHLTKPLDYSKLSVLLTPMASRQTH